MAGARMTRLLDPARELSWLAQGADELGSVTGYDRSGWEDSIWVLHAMWEQPTGMPVPSFDEVRRRAIAEGRLSPAIIGGVNLDADTVATGVPLGYVTAPGDGWVRLRWADLARRLGFPLGAGQKVPPCCRWFPYRSWPVNVAPPAEGSLDEIGLHAVLRVLARCSAAAGETLCHAFYASVPSGDFDAPTMFRGPLQAVPDLVTEPTGMGASPSNVWPDDRSWFVYTDWDLWATKVSGSRQLTAAIAACPDLETFAWTDPSEPAPEGP